MLPFIAVLYSAFRDALAVFAPFIPALIVGAVVGAAIFLVVKIREVSE